MHFNISSDFICDFLTLKYVKEVNIELLGLQCLTKA
jgi:hypothetical protein